jgi:Fe-S cluster assembly protein SufD
MNSLSLSQVNMTTHFKSLDFFRAFSEKRSWEPGWMADFRKDSWSRYIELPKSKVKDERWRFSPRARFSYSTCEQLLDSPKQTKLANHNTKKVIFESFDQAILEHPKLLSKLPSFSGPQLGSDETFLLGSSFSESGFLLNAEKGFKEEAAFKCNHFAPKENHSLFQQNIVTLEPFAELTLIEYFDSEDDSTAGVLSNLSHIHLGEGAKLNRIVVQRINSHSTFHHLEKVELERNSQFNNISLQLGSAQTRVESRGDILGEGAEFNNYSLSLGRNDQLFDQRTIQHHIAPHGKSNLLFKNALLDESKAVFSGLIKVDPKAQNTDSFQTNRNLLLSKEAEADSLPGLEILANEVKCSHGATTSKIDEQELFYLQSRGISKSIAEKLIVLGFFEEIIGRAGNSETIESLRNEVSNYFTS